MIRGIHLRYVNRFGAKGGCAASISSQVPGTRNTSRSIFECIIISCYYLICRCLRRSSCDSRLHVPIELQIRPQMQNARLSSLYKNAYAPAAYWVSFLSNSTQNHNLTLHERCSEVLKFVEELLHLRHLPHWLVLRFRLPFVSSDRRQIIFQVSGRVRSLRVPVIATDIVR
jgi:hypothetical protein